MGCTIDMDADSVYWLLSPLPLPLSKSSITQSDANINGGGTSDLKRKLNIYLKDFWSTS